MSEKAPSSAPSHEEWIQRNPDFEGLSAEAYKELVPGSSPEEDIDKAYVVADGVNHVYENIKSLQNQADRWRNDAHKDETGEIEEWDHRKAAVEVNERLIASSQESIPEVIAEMSRIYDEVQAAVAEYRHSIEQKIAPDPIDVFDVDNIPDEHLREYTAQVQESIAKTVEKARQELDAVDADLLSMKAEEEGFVSSDDYKDGFKRLHYFHPTHPQYSFENWISSLKARQAASYVVEARNNLKERLTKAGVSFDTASSVASNEAA